MSKNYLFPQGYLYELMGILVTGAVFPLACTLLWSKLNWAAVVVAPIVSTICAIISWLVCASALYGEANIVTTGSIW